jgi:hypothetical protein
MKLSDIVRKVLLEDVVDDKLTDLAKKFDAASVEDYVTTLQKYATDPKVAAVLKAGRTDAKGEPDEQFSVSNSTPEVKNLRPTQNEIGAAESLKNILTDQYGSLDGFLKGKSSFPDPIIIYNNEYVIDGHHRWSQVYAANPDATIPALNITGKLDPKQILKVVHAAIAADAGQTKTISANRSGGNLLTYTEADVAKYVKENLNDTAREVWAKYGFDSDEAISRHISSNVRTMVEKSKPASWAPTRDSMPQPGVSGADNWGKLMTQGTVNFDEPTKSDVKESVKHRLTKLANIKK